jgi:hypothetical protein
VNEAEQQVCTIEQHLEAAQPQRKSYADKRRKPIDFAVGDHVYGVLIDKSVLAEEMPSSSRRESGDSGYQVRIRLNV